MRIFIVPNQTRMLKQTKNEKDLNFILRFAYF